MIGNKLKQENVFLRPPVVAVVGHIDHGKTSLLDKIRETHVAAREAGGITQHIGASQIEFKTKEKTTRKITFIDTPGHAAFAKMRARGVETTDLVILVVAADAGVQEQTKESIKFIQTAGVPFLVALNKIDLPAADPNKIKGELTEVGVISEDYGGQTVVIPVSAKTGQGIEELLEMICLIADLKGIKSSLTEEMEGVVIEATLDSQRGPVATILVKNGVLKTGEEIFAEMARAKIKMMKTWMGKVVNEAVPGDPIEILGFESVPEVGAKVGRKIGIAKEISTPEREEEEAILKMVVKADVQGTMEAVLNSLPKGVKVIDSGIGPIIDQDLFLAQTTGAEVFGFNVKTLPSALKLSEQSKIPIFTTKIIYELLEELERRLFLKRDPFVGKEIAGKAEIIAEFKIKGKRIAGAKVTEGKITKGSKAYLSRIGNVIGETNLSSLRHLQEEIETAKVDEEFGIVFSPDIDFLVGDAIISYKQS